MGNPVFQNPPRFQVGPPGLEILEYNDRTHSLDVIIISTGRVCMNLPLNNVMNIEFIGDATVRMIPRTQWTWPCSMKLPDTDAINISLIDHLERERFGQLFLDRNVIWKRRNLLENPA